MTPDDLGALGTVLGRTYADDPLEPGLCPARPNPPARQDVPLAAACQRGPPRDGPDRRGQPSLAGGASGTVLGRAFRYRPTSSSGDVDAPMEYAAVAYVVLASIFAANVVGRLTSPVLGWLAFGVMLVALTAGTASYRGRRRQAQHLAAVADRAELARARGWRYEAKAPELALPASLATHSDSFLGPEAIRHVNEIMDGTMDVGDVVPAPRAITPDEIEAETKLPGFAQALLTPEVRGATLADGLIGWRIEGRDLIFVSARHATPASAAWIVDTAERLIALARLFPADLAERYGTAPTTDIPLPIGAA